MQIMYELESRKRKELCEVIAKATGEAIKYLGTPTYAYQIGEIKVERDATVIGLNEKVHQSILEAGFSVMNQENETGFTVSVPLIEADELGKLENLLTAKRVLIEKALNTDRVSFEVQSDHLEFPWFDEQPDQEVIQATVIFIEKIIQYIKERKFISAKETQTDNDKYTFRTFLLAIGMIGPDYKDVRNILLKELSGNSAFRFPKEAQNG